MRNLYSKRALFLASFCLLMPISVLAGGMGSGGGGAFICADPLRSELLDLFEARVPGIVTNTGLKIPANDTDDVETQIRTAFDKLSPGSPLYQKVLESYEIVKSSLERSVPADVSIEWPKDANNELTKNGCVKKGIIKYFDGENANSDWKLTDKEALLSLPRQQQAALWVHEAIYKFLRQTQSDRDSVRTRKIVGHLFARETERERNEALAQIANWHPHASNTLSASKEGLTFSAGYPGQSVNLRVTVDVESDSTCAFPVKRGVYFGNTASAMWLGLARGIEVSNSEVGIRFKAGLITQYVNTYVMSYPVQRYCRSTVSVVDDQGNKFSIYDTDETGDVIRRHPISGLSSEEDRFVMSKLSFFGKPTLNY